LLLPIGQVWKLKDTPMIYLRGELVLEAQLDAPLILLRRAEEPAPCKAHLSAQFMSSPMIGAYPLANL
jgi:hypothetical protein